jgi:formylglycine-generating enzyme required for sulfatase activity
MLQTAKKLCTSDGTSRAVFDDEKLKWTQTNFVSTQMHPYDRYFYDPVQQEYTPDKYVKDVVARYGGLDSLLLWPSYPTLGIDNRNMFDIFDALPVGGRKALKHVVEKLDRDYGIKVLLPFTPWDRGTRFCDGCQTDSDHEVGHSLLKLLNDTGAFGFNGDTMGFVAKDDYWSNDTTTGVSIEPEGMGTPEMRAWHTMGWGYWSWNWATNSQLTVPGVDFYKNAWDGRWITHGCERWNKNHTNYVQTAYLNGAGFNAWENVWGIWNGIVERDGELIRRVAAIQRFFSTKGDEMNDGFFNSADDAYPFYEYNGCYPTTADCAFNEEGIYASYFPRKSVGDAVYTMVNRLDADKTVDFYFGSPVENVYDCYSNKQVQWTTEASVSVTVQGNGIACLYTVDATPKDKDAIVPKDALHKFLSEIAGVTEKPLDSYSGEWKMELQKMEPNGANPDGANGIIVAKTNSKMTWRMQDLTSESGLLESQEALKLAMEMTPLDGDATAFYNSDKRLLKIDGADSYDWYVQGQMIEGDENQFGVDVQYPWEDRPYKTHKHTFSPMKSFYLDKYPVTVADYALYLNKTGYTGGKDIYNFLKNWDGSLSNPDTSLLKLPVTYLGIAEARAFCVWRGARLPHSYEWQYAAQGNGDSARVYPWNTKGDPAATYDFTSGQKCPTPLEGKDTPVAAPVDSFGAQAGTVAENGVSDMVGNIWQYTDAFADAHTRGAVVRGSGRYFSGKPFSSMWYFPRAQELTKSNKMLLMDNSYERNAMTGFRCAADAVEVVPDEAVESVVYV